MEDNIVTLYAKGLSTREIADTIQEIYGVEVSTPLSSK